MGWNEDQHCVRGVGAAGRGSGLNAVALHARTREQGYSGQARWKWIGAVKAAVTIPVIGNGDILHARGRLRHGGANGVRCGDDRAGGAGQSLDLSPDRAVHGAGRYDRPTEFDRYHMIRSYFEMLVEESAADGGESGGSQASNCQGKMKQFASWFTHGVAGGAALRKVIYECKTGVAILAAVDRFFEARMMDSETGAIAAPEDDSEEMAFGACVS